MSGDDYRRLSVPEKEARNREAMREPAIVCPSCETQTTVADMPRHLASCPGPREPHPLSRWITWASAMRLGVSKRSLHYWTSTGLVRVEIVRGHRRYLERDVVMRIALRATRYKRVTITRKRRPKK